MDCFTEVRGLEVDIGDTVYEVIIGQVQIEITGRCNMTCQHCRASEQPQVDMPASQVEKIMRFARRYSPGFKEVIVSGGEPTLHRQFPEVLKVVREHGGNFVTLTTNGLTLSRKHIDAIRDLAFERFTFSVSLDSLSAERHNAFRGHDHAFERAVVALKLIADSHVQGVEPSMRSTIQPDQIPEMEDMVRMALGFGCQKLSFSAIQPAGRAGRHLQMDRDGKRRFLEELYRLKSKYPSINITTSDVLKCLLRGFSDVGGENEILFDGCGAAAITFNVNSDGTMTPCALLNMPMMNVFDLSVDEIAEQYRRSEIVRNMLEMNLKGKCGRCALKYQCGGCRARAFAETGDYLAEDPHCWM